MPSSRDARRGAAKADRPGVRPPRGGADAVMPESAPSSACERGDVAVGGSATAPGPTDGGTLAGCIGDAGTSSVMAIAAVLGRTEICVSSCAPAVELTLRAPPPSVPLPVGDDGCTPSLGAAVAVERFARLTDMAAGSTPPRDARSGFASPLVPFVVVSGGGGGDDEVPFFGA